MICFDMQVVLGNREVSVHVTDVFPDCQQFIDALAFQVSFTADAGQKNFILVRQPSGWHITQTQTPGSMAITGIIETCRTAFTNTEISRLGSGIEKVVSDKLARHLQQLYYPFPHRAHLN